MWAVCAQPPVCGHVVPGLRFLLRCGGWELRWRRMPLRSLGLVQTSAPWERRRPSWRFEGHAVAELVARALIGALGQPGPERCGCTVLWANMGFRARPADQCPPGSMTKDLHNPTIVALQRFAKRGRPLHVKARTAPPILLRTKSTWKRNGWKAKVPDVEWTYTLVTFSKPCIAPILNLDHLFWKGFGFALCKYRSVLSQKALMLFWFLWSCCCWRPWLWRQEKCLWCNDAKVGFGQSLQSGLCLDIVIVYAYCKCFWQRYSLHKDRI